jgi:hypothetical protein
MHEEREGLVGSAGAAGHGEAGAATRTPVHLVTDT